MRTPPSAAQLSSAEPRFDVDLGDLERRYKALQRRLHPDKFSQASAFEQEYAHQQARAAQQGGGCWGAGGGGQGCAGCCSQCSLA